MFSNLINNAPKSEVLWFYLFIGACIVISGLSGYLWFITTNNLPKIKSKVDEMAIKIDIILNRRV